MTARHSTGSRAIRQQRARYARTNGDMLIGGPINPGDADPVTFWWMGDDRLITSTPNARLAAVTRATSLITGLAGLPWRVLETGTGPGGGVELPGPMWLTDPMLQQPDDRVGASATPAALRLSRADFWAQVLKSVLLRGMGYLLFAEDDQGAPVAGTLRVLHPYAVEPVEQPYVHRRIGHGPDAVATDFDGRFTVGGMTYRLVEFRNPLDVVDELGCTRGVLEMHAAEVGMARQQVEYGTGTYRSGVPAGYLKVSVPNYSADQADRLKQRWLEAHGGDRRSIAVLNATTDFQPISMSPVDMALIEARRMSLVDIANAFGVPVHMLGGTDGGSNTYSNAWSRNADFVRYSLLQWANAVDDTLTGLVPAGQSVQVSFDAMLRADTKTRFEAYSIGLADGWLTVDEVRAQENLPPLPDGPASGDGRTVAEAVQKVYLGVGSVLTSDEARQIVNEAGGSLDLANPQRPAAAAGGGAA